MLTKLYDLLILQKWRNSAS